MQNSAEIRAFRNRKQQMLSLRIVACVDIKSTWNGCPSKGVTGLFQPTLEAKIKVCGLHNSESSNLGWSNSLLEERFLKKISVSSLCPHSTQPKARGSTTDGSQCWLQIRIQKTFCTSVSRVWPLDQNYQYQEMQNLRHIQTHLIRIALW